jgi:hypothetical protein
MTISRREDITFNPTSNDLTRVAKSSSFMCPRGKVMSCTPINYGCKITQHVTYARSSFLVRFLLVALGCAVKKNGKMVFGQKTCFFL